MTWSFVIEIAVPVLIALGLGFGLGRRRSRKQVADTIQTHGVDIRQPETGESLRIAAYRGEPYDDQPPRILPRDGTPDIPPYVKWIWVAGKVTLNPNYDPDWFLRQHESEVDR